ncbi:type II toxin-antitoxin system Phd/YefM family antitoxin [Glycomyces tritici]|uniref:Antitoxin n=1 Tax=Glycomyces tritici TaxID=2665176 RepID=A0ABT7YXZ6_9ACTN|nr:type II toxin-antitoxin system prevent-host-death family antitoxin [Glycomyces tritici]MDN3243522.1 type II toxin-antitoxin system prevent-host-death family antitoxin [Glycomyces tritici]
MREITVREFSHNPSAILAQAEKGEPVTVTKRGKPIAILVPASGHLGRYSQLVAEGRVRLTSFTTDDLDRRPRYRSDRPGNPIQTILDMKDEDAGREADMHRILGGEPERDLPRRLRAAGLERAAGPGRRPGRLFEEAS